jgi:hypothetical protein
MRLVLGHVIALLVFAGLVTVSRTSTASCGGGSSGSVNLCYCNAQATYLVEGHLTATDAGTLVVAVDSVLASPDGGEAPGSLSVQSEPGDAAGQKVLVGFYSDGSTVNVRDRLNINPDGTVTCLTPATSARLDEAQVVSGLQSSNCETSLGGPPTPQPAATTCHDTGGPFGCNSSAASVSLLALLAVLGRRLKRS